MPNLNFVFIGPGRSGTTFIDSVLRHDERIALPERIKETNHFLKEGKTTEDRFWSFFENSCGEKSACGEVANMYVYDSRSIPNLASMGEQLTLHAILRNPYDRLVSSLRFRLSAGEIIDFKNFEDTFSRYPSLIEQSAYATLLKPFLDQFGTRLKFYSFDDLRSNPEFVVRQFYNNIGLTAPASIPLEQTKQNIAQSPRSQLLIRVGRTMSDGLRRLGMLGLLGRLKESILVSKLLYTGTPLDINTSTWPPEVIARLNNEIEELSRLLEKDFSHWKRAV